MNSHNNDKANIAAFKVDEELLELIAHQQKPYLNIHIIEDAQIINKFDKLLIGNKESFIKLLPFLKNYKGSLLLFFCASGMGNIKIELNCQIYNFNIPYKIKDIINILRI